MRRPPANAALIDDLSSPRWLERAAEEFQSLRSVQWAPLDPQPKPKSPAAVRSARRRERKRQHRIVVGVEVGEQALDVLAASGFLCAADETSPCAIAEAIEKLLARSRPFAG